MTRGRATRDHLLAVAERLFAEEGVVAVSNRRVAAAAGCGDNTAVGYHFGTKEDLVRAVVRRHAASIEALRAVRVAALGPELGVRGWVECTVHPVTDHLAGLGAPTWFGRFGAQVATDPALRRATRDEALSSPVLVGVLDGLRACLPDLTAEERRGRAELTRALLVHGVAEQERSLAEDAEPLWPSWPAAGDAIVRAAAAVWSA